MKSKKQTLNQSIRKYALLPIIITLPLFCSAFSIKAQSNNIQQDTVKNQETPAVKESDYAYFDGPPAMPQFPGGDAGLLKWIANNIRYPEEAVKNKIEGRVVLRCIIKSDGSVDNVAVLKGLYPPCDSEAVRVVRMMPKWIPIKEIDNPRDVYYSIPVTFRLSKIIQENTSEVIETPDSTVVMPQFPGGQKALLNFLAKNIKYPFDALRNNIQGRVILRFIIMTDGSIENVEIVQHVNPSLDNEAIQVVKRMPKWIPGTKNGEPANVYFTLPVIFRLTSSNIRIGY